MSNSRNSRQSISKSQLSEQDRSTLARQALQASLTQQTSQLSNDPRASISRSSLLRGPSANGSTQQVPESFLSGSMTAVPGNSDPLASMSRSSMSKQALNTMAQARLRTSLGMSSVSGVAPPRPPRMSAIATQLPDSLDLYALQQQRRTTGTLPSRTRAVPSLNNATRVQQSFQAEETRALSQAPRKSVKGIFGKACSTDLLFLMDNTYSMEPYQDAVKRQAKGIINDLHKAFLGKATIRVAVVTYTDHGSPGNPVLFNFTHDVDAACSHIDNLKTEWGIDFPEDVLGGLDQALRASWEQSNRCIIHIGDAPAHGEALNEFDSMGDRFHNPGSEPHGLTYEPLLQAMIRGNINYTFMRVGDDTDKMTFEFSKFFTGSVTLHKKNKYGKHTASRTALVDEGPQFQELELGTNFAALRGHVVSSVTSAFSATASRASKTHSAAVQKQQRKINALTSINENAEETLDTVTLDKGAPQWNSPSWLDKNLDVEGRCPAVPVYNHETLQDMLAADDGIELGHMDITLRYRSKPFDKGAMRTASYARTAHSDNQQVVKSFIRSGKGLAEMSEDMRMQALCKAFALEFNALLDNSSPLDFAVSSCLKSKTGTDTCLSLEPYLPGKYEKYNSNSGYVMEGEDSINLQAQAFSHFTFERSWGEMIVTDLQGVGRVLTDPSIQTKDENRFKLNDTNLGQSGMEFFFATHICNKYCSKLKLESKAEMFMAGETFSFRSTWPYMTPTFCCSNKLCQSIVRKDASKEDDRYPGHKWCSTCWPQLKESCVKGKCEQCGTGVDVNAFFWESQGTKPVTKCPAHLDEEMSELMAKMTSTSINENGGKTASKGSIAGNEW